MNNIIKQNNMKKKNRKQIILMFKEDWQQPSIKMSILYSYKVCIHLDSVEYQEI